MDEKLEGEIDKVRNGLHGMDIRMTAHEVEWNTTKGWLKFIFGTSLVGLVVNLLVILRMFEVI